MHSIWNVGLAFACTRFPFASVCAHTNAVHTGTLKHHWKTVLESTSREKSMCLTLLCLPHCCSWVLCVRLYDWIGCAAHIHVQTCVLDSTRLCVNGQNAMRWKMYRKRTLTQTGMDEWMVGYMLQPPSIICFVVNNLSLPIRISTFFDFPLIFSVWPL